MIVVLVTLTCLSIASYGDISSSAATRSDSGTGSSANLVRHISKPLPSRCDLLSISELDDVYAGGWTVSFGENLPPSELKKIDALTPGYTAVWSATCQWKANRGPFEAIVDVTMGKPTPSYSSTATGACFQGGPVRLQVTSGYAFYCPLDYSYYGANRGEGISFEVSALESAPRTSRSDRVFETMVSKL